MENEIAWARLTAAELNARASAGALVIVPVASLEQHGPHLATGVDIVLASAVAERSARKLMAAGVPAVVTPCVWTGLAEHHVAFGGTVTLEYDAFAAVIGGVVRSAARAGFQRVMLLNGHGGNSEAIAVLAGELQSALGIVVAAGTYWHLAGDAFAPILERQESVLHACEAETSMMLALQPDSVRQEKLGEAHGPFSTRPPGQPAALARRRSFRAVTASGVLGDARVASAAKGEALLEAAAERIAAALSAPGVWSEGSA